MAIAAVGLMIPPITRWYITMAMGTDDLAAKMERQTILQDKWNTLNATSFDDITELIKAKGGSSWSEDVGKYTITTTIDAAGKYANAACTDGTPGEDDRQCRQVHLTIKDNETGKTQALDVTKIAPENGGGGGGGGGYGLDYSRKRGILVPNRMVYAGHRITETATESGLVYANDNGNGFRETWTILSINGVSSPLYLYTSTYGNYRRTQFALVSKGDIISATAAGESSDYVWSKNVPFAYFIPYKK